MCVQSPSSNLISSGFWNECFLKSREHGAGNHHGSSESATFFPEYFVVQVVNVNRVGLECAGMPINAICFYTHFAKQFYQQVHIKYIGNIADGYLFCSKQHHANNLQCFILCALWNN